MTRRLILFFILSIGAMAVIISCANFNIPALSKRVEKGNVAVAEEYYKNALDSEEKGDIYGALVNLKLALKNNPKNKEISEKYNSIIKSLHSEIIGTQEVIKKGSGIVNPIIYKLYRKNEENIYPVQGMPVHFKLINATGTITEKDITNDAGEAKCFIENIESYTGNISIEAYILIPDDKNGEKIDSLTKSFTFINTSVLDKSIKILPESKNFSNMNEIFNIIHQNIMEVLNQDGFTNVSIMPSFNVSLFDNAVKLNKAAIQKLGKESASEILFLFLVNKQLNLQQSFDFYMKKISIQIIIADTKNGKVYLNEIIEGKGAERTEKEAEDKAVRNAFLKLEEVLRNYLEEVKIKNEFFKFSIKGESVSSGS